MPGLMGRPTSAKEEALGGSPARHAWHHPADWPDKPESRADGVAMVLRGPPARTTQKDPRRPDFNNNVFANIGPSLISVLATSSMAPEREGSGQAEAFACAGARV